MTQINPVTAVYHVFRTNRYAIQESVALIPESITYVSPGLPDLRFPDSPTEQHFPVTDSFEWEHFAGNLAHYIRAYVHHQMRERNERQVNRDVSATFSFQPPYHATVTGSTISRTSELSPEEQRAFLSAFAQVISKPYYQRITLEEAL